jgi:hypothetical protein
MLRANFKAMFIFHLTMLFAITCPFTSYLYLLLKNWIRLEDVSFGKELEQKRNIILLDG